MSIHTRVCSLGNVNILRNKSQLSVKKKCIFNLKFIPSQDEIKNLKPFLTFVFYTLVLK